MTGETQLSTLLARLSPTLLPDHYVFCFVPSVPERTVFESPPIATFREEGGMSVVLTESEARRLSQPVSARFRCISLGVHSSLSAVGLTARISGELAQAGISANVIAAFHHDHFFVPADRSDDAMALIEGLQIPQT